MKPRIDPNKWYCENSIPCIQKAKSKNKICVCALGRKKQGIHLACKDLGYRWVNYIQGFWILMKNPQNSENNT